jgi:hypothetical protein
MAPKRARGRSARVAAAPRVAAAVPGVAAAAAAPRAPAAARPRRAAAARPRVAATRGRVARGEEAAESPSPEQPAPRAARGRPRTRQAPSPAREATPLASARGEHSIAPDPDFVDDVIGQRVADFLGPGADRDFPNLRAHRTPTLMSCIRDLKDLQTREFKGDRDPVAADSWLTEVADDLVRAAIPEKFQVDAIASRFRGEAAQWWRVRKASGDVTAGHLTWTWFERVFREEYVPVSAMRRFEA